MTVNEGEYEVTKLPGKGKGGYSYLASDGGKEYVLKQIHHEPCDYYQFGNKIEAEINKEEANMALLHVDFFSTVLGMSMNMDVILPQQTWGQIGMEGKGEDRVSAPWHE